MDNELKTKLLEYLQTWESSIEKAGTFVEIETPLVVSEYITWVMVRQGCLAMVLFAIAITLIVLARSLWPSIKKNDGNDDLGNDDLGCVIVLVVLIVASTIGGTVAFGYAAKAVIAPRIVVLEKLQELTR